MIDPDIAAHYGLGLEEHRLFVDGRPRLEYLRTLELLERLLPAAPARVLDIGGGTGAYALALAARGFSVRLLDPIDEHVRRAAEIAEAAGQTNNLRAQIGDARDLSTAGEDYDAVLMLGPLYHLTDAADREQAFAEAIRVARPGGVVIAIGICRFASLLDGLKRKILDDSSFRDIVERDLHDGQHRNPDPIGRPEYFTTAFFHHPDELEQEAVDAGLQEVQLLAVEGPAWIVEDIDDIDNQLQAARAVERERSLMGATSHLLVAGNAP